MEEEIVRLGDDHRIVGILSVPAAGSRSDLPGIVILNAGIVHRVGPNRLHVRVARKLAEAGQLALRFDLSGIGDSEPDTTSEGLEESMESDVRAAIDFLHARGCARVILLGLCSGAHLAANCARKEPRVVGAILIDPVLPPTIRSMMTRVRSRAIDPKVWWNLLSGKTPLRRYINAATGRTSRSPEAANALVQAQQTLCEIVAHKTRLLVVLTGENYWYSHRNHLQDVFPAVDFADHLRTDFIEEADHVFSLESAQRRLIATVLEWTATTSFRNSTEIGERIETR